MTTRTRRRLMICAIIATLSLPAELVLLQALTTDQQGQAGQWGNNLSDAQAETASENLQSYPFQYRRAIMKKLKPEKRAKVWRAHIQTYLDMHPEFSTDQVEALEAAIDAASPEAFDSPSALTRAIGVSAAERVVAVFGKEIADFLLYRLGPKSTPALASAAPLSLRLADFVRERFVVNASEEDGVCDCALSWGCDANASLVCRNNTGCTPTSSWPACGWWWNETCDAGCRVGMEGE